MNYSDDYIEHHGVLGMKWGVRKDRSSGGSGSAKKAAKKARKASAKAARKNLSLGTRALATTGKVIGTLGGAKLGADVGALAGGVVGAVALSALGGPASTAAVLSYVAATTGGSFTGAAIGGIKVHDITDKAIDNLLIEESNRVTKNK